MGFIDDKNSIIKQVGLFEILGDLPKGKNRSNIDSVNSSSKNLLPFLLDLLTISCKDKTKLPKVKDRAKCDLIRIFTEILTEFFPVFMRIIKESIVKGIKAGILCPADFKIPSSGLSVDLKPNEFDFNKITSIDPNEFPARLLYGDADKDLNVFLSNLIQGGVGTADTWKNILDFEVIEYTINNTYTTTSDIGLRVSINDSYIDKEFDVLLKDFVDSIEIFNYKNFIPNLMDEFNGSITDALASNNPLHGLDIEKSTNKEKVNKAIEKVLDTDPCALTENFFIFNSDELLDIEKNAQNRLSGLKLVDYSCEPLLFGAGSLLFEDDFDDFARRIDDNPNSAELVTNEYLNTLLNSLASGNQGFGDDVKKSLSFELSLTLPKLATSVILSPKIMVLYQVSKKMVTNTISENENNFDFVKANKVFFEYVVRDSTAALLKILYEKIKQEVIRLVISLTISLVKEAINKRIKQLKSLTVGSSNKSGLSEIKIP
jgi:hypothetical protein